MKKVLIIMLMMMSMTAMSNRRPSPDERNAAAAQTAQPAALQAQEDLLHKKWHMVIEAIATVESDRNPGKVSPSGKYVGYLQISEILVREVNRIVGYDKYTYADRLDRDKSIAMFIDYQEHYNRDGNMERAIRLWNSGDLKCMSRKARTEGYYKKVMSSYTHMAANR